ncbi:MAG: Lrp/AsnC family transcriptional regulator [Promethearchaeota archaeon]
MPKGVEVVMNIYVVSEKLDEVAEELVKLNEVIDLYEVTGDSDIIALIRTDDIAAFRNLLKNSLMKTPGIKSTISSVILHTRKKDSELIDE